jgi:nucleotide-binding universal stress UspA family protein
MVLAVDSNELDLPEKAKVVDQLLGNLHCKLAIMHVSRAESHAEAAGRRAVYEVRRSGLAALPDEETAHLVCNADAATGILQGADELEADLLVIVARPHSWVGSLFHRSVTAQVIKKSTIPVLVLPALH